MNTDLEIYDTTLRDGSQQEGISLTVNDKLRIAALLDDLGVGYIEGGWPGALPKDDEFFKRARTEIDFKHATLTAFGSTRRPRVTVSEDPQLDAPHRGVVEEPVEGGGDLLAGCRLGRRGFCRWCFGVGRGIVVDRQGRIIPDPIAAALIELGRGFKYF